MSRKEILVSSGKSSYPRVARQVQRIGKIMKTAKIPVVIDHPTGSVEPIPEPNRSEK